MLGSSTTPTSHSDSPPRDVAVSALLQHIIKLGPTVGLAEAASSLVSYFAHVELTHTCNELCPYCRDGSPLVIENDIGPPHETGYFHDAATNLDCVAHNVRRAFKERHPTINQLQRPQPPEVICSQTSSNPPPPSISQVFQQVLNLRRPSVSGPPQVGSSTTSGGPSSTPTP